MCRDERAELVLMTGVFREESGGIESKRDNRTKSTKHRLYYRDSRFIFWLLIPIDAFNNREERHKTAANRWHADSAKMALSHNFGHFKALDRHSEMGV